MDYKLVFVISFVTLFVILATISGWTLCVNAQDDSIKNDSSSGAKTTSMGNISSIITPWNTGNDRNNVGASGIG